MPVRVFMSEYMHECVCNRVNVFATLTGGEIFNISEQTYDHLVPYVFIVRVFKSFSLYLASTDTFYIVLSLLRI